MRRKLALLSLAVAASTALAGTPSHADPVADAVRTVNKAVGHDVGGGGGGVGPAGGVHSAVVGWIAISYQTALLETRPTYTTYGALSDPTMWTCSDNYPTAPYKVTCKPVPGTILDWHCDVLHANISTTLATSRARTTLDCDGGATAPEAQTGIVVGAGYDYQWAQSAVLVTEFSCQIDGGGLPASPDYTGGCGDPGLPTVG